MKFKKFASLLTAAALSASLLVACGNGNDDSDASKDNNENAEETVSGASISANADDLVKVMSADGNWIFAATADITLDEDLDVEGEFHDKGDDSNELYRKLALYTQDDDHKVIDVFTLTVPKINVNSPNFRIQEGTVKGDIYVNAEGFELLNATVDGDVTFASKELMDSAKLDKGTVKGEVAVAE